MMYSPPVSCLPDMAVFRSHSGSLSVCCDHTEEQVDSLMGQPVGDTDDLFLWPGPRDSYRTTWKSDAADWNFGSLEGKRRFQDPAAPANLTGEHQDNQAFYLEK